jgi:hypothetical protein
MGMCSARFGEVAPFERLPASSPDEMKQKPWSVYRLPRIALRFIQAKKKAD